MFIFSKLKKLCQWIKIGIKEHNFDLLNQKLLSNVWKNVFFILK